MHSAFCICRRSPFVALLSILLATYSSLAQDNRDTSGISIDGTIHTFDEIATIMESSELAYVIGEMSDKAHPGDTILPVLLPTLYVDGLAGDWEPKTYRVSDSAGNLYQAAEDAYSAENYQLARQLYRETLVLEPSFAVALTMIGDTYFVENLLDSAILYFEKSIASNFHSYQAHWFLADALWETGDSLRAIDEITLAHLLNRNHEKIFEKMVRYRREAGTGWDEWDFHPLYSVARDSVDSHRIHIEVAAGWIVYGAVKATWEYEPGYAEKMLAGVETAYDRYLLEEREAVACQLLATKGEDYAIELVDAGFFDTFVIYEVLSRRNPSLMYGSTLEMLNRFARYLTEYH